MLAASLLPPQSCASSRNTWVVDGGRFDMKYDTKMSETNSFFTLLFPPAESIGYCTLSGLLKSFRIQFAMTQKHFWSDHLATRYDYFG